MSQVCQEVMRNVDKNPLIYEAWHEDLVGPNEVITVYIKDELWEPVKDKLHWERLSIATVLRAGITAVLAGEKVPSEVP